MASGRFSLCAQALSSALWVWWPVSVYAGKSSFFSRRRSALIWCSSGQHENIVIRTVTTVCYLIRMVILHPAVAQKLTGKVRIANIRYLESFRSASSKEYQDFLELFFRVVSRWEQPRLLWACEGGRSAEPCLSLTQTCTFP